MIINRYLAREVLTSLLAVTFVLMATFLSQQVVRYLTYVAAGKIPASILLTLVSFEVPYLLALLLPLGLYLGIMLAYGRLYADQEMAVMQLCGFNRQKLLRLTVRIGLVAAIIVLGLMLWVNPWISAKRQVVMSSDEATLHMIKTLVPGRFQVSADGTRVMYVEQLSRNHARAENIFFAQEKVAKDTPSGRTWGLVLANQGFQTKDNASDDQFFVTTDGYRYEGTPGANDYKVIQFKKYAVRIPEVNAHVNHPQSETLPTQILWQNYSNPNHAAELQWRFSIAISVMLLALLAVPFSSLRPRQGRYLMFLPAILIYICYIDLLFIARHWVEQSKVPVTIGMWWVHGLIILLLFMMSIFPRLRFRK